MTAFKLFLAGLCIVSSNGFTAAPARYAIRPLYAEESAEPEPSSEADAPPEGAVPPEAAAPPTEDVSDILNSPAFLKKKIEVLEGDLKKLEASTDEANAIYEANKAEWSEKFDKLNDDSRLMQERLSKQSESAKSEATVEVVQQMLNVIDTYERAFNSVDPSTPEQEAIVAEYRATYDKILECFDELNVTKIKTVGAEFDYEMHQAMMQMPNDEFEAGVVCQEFAPGWVVGDKLVRPAMVAVAC